MKTTNKPVILTFIGYYLPGYKSGGPVRTISNMLALLSDNYFFKIITRDRDYLENKTYENIKVNEWNSLQGSEVFYHNLKLSIRKIINNTIFDIYYLNSLFDFHFSIKVILLHKLKLIPQKQIILAPRGELFEGALANKYFIKRVFISVAKLINLYKNVIWHASSPFEENLIKKQFGNKVKTRIAIDVPQNNFLKKVQRTHKKEKGFLKILFISRIAQTKNLKFVIDVLNQVKNDFCLDIYGPVVDHKYWNICLNSIEPELKNKIKYKGIVHNDKIHEIYPQYDLLFFPTLGESFGHVIFESLSFGTPVLSTNSTPWNNLAHYNAGWNIDLNNLEEYKSLIKHLILLDDVSYRIYVEGCSVYLEAFKEENNIKQNNIKLFEL